MTTEYFKQCFLEKDDRRQWAWIEEKFAVKGKWVKLKDEDGWQVIDVFENMKRTWEEVKEHEDRVHKGIFGSIKA